jgi:hypothetical protein
MPVEVPKAPAKQEAMIIFALANIIMVVHYKKF